MSASGLAYGAPSASDETAPARRRFLCMSCGQATLEPVLAPDVAARCTGCRWETNDLLTLVPVRPAPLPTLVLGEGALAWVRLGVFVAVAGGLAALLLRP